LSAAEFEALTSDVCGKGNFDKTVALELEEKRFGIEGVNDPPLPSFFKLLLCGVFVNKLSMVICSFFFSFCERRFNGFV
jgi:hypothetical protein